jgi:3-methyl-2-oxobutanoate hydroxymethyltransferase
MHDMLGINIDFSPRFIRKYANLHEIIDGAVKEYIKDVRSGSFPNEEEQY